MAKKKTWRDKVDEIEEKIHVITPEYEKRYGKGKILIASAVDIERLILETRKGELLTNDIIREKLAREKNAYERKPISKEEALGFFEEKGDEYKIELIEKRGEEI